MGRKLNHNLPQNLGNFDGTWQARSHDMHFKQGSGSVLESLITALPAFMVRLIPAVLVYFLFMRSKWSWYHVLNLGAGIMVVWVLVMQMLNNTLSPTPTIHKYPVRDFSAQF